MERRLAANRLRRRRGYFPHDGRRTKQVHTPHSRLIEARLSDRPQSRGRVVKNTGDGFLIEFPSVVGAIESAIAMQMLMQNETAQLPGDRVMQFRMGVHMGDVMAGRS